MTTAIDALACRQRADSLRRAAAMLRQNTCGWLPFHARHTDYIAEQYDAVADQLDMDADEIELAGRVRLP